MSKKTLRVPSAQHLARNWNESSEMTAKALVRLFNNSPTFNYNAVFSAVRDMLVLGVPYGDVERGMREKIKRDDVRMNFLEILPLIRSHFDGENPDFVNEVSPRHYPLARGRDGLMLYIPFNPPMVYGVGGKLVFPWISFWRINPLMGEKLQLFTTIVKGILAQDPDLDEADFQIHDYSASKPGYPRTLTVISAADVPSLSPSRRDEMLLQFADGFSLAQRLIKNEEARREWQRQQEREEEVLDPRQREMFR